MIHELSNVLSVNIGGHTRIWQYAVVMKGAVIGSNCNIGSHTFIEDDVIIGNNVTIKNGVYLWNGLRIEDNVFIGPGVVFTNDLYPRSRGGSTPVSTVIQHGASIGAGSAILCGINIGTYSMAGMGAVVTKDIPAHALVYGNPAKVMGWVDEEGRKMKRHSGDKWISESLIVYNETGAGLERQ